MAWVGGASGDILMTKILTKITMITMTNILTMANGDHDHEGGGAGAAGGDH